MTNPYSDGRFDPDLASPQPGGGGFAAVGGQQPAAQPPQPSGGGFAAVGGQQITQAQGQTGSRPSFSEIAAQSARHEQEMRQPMNRLGEPVSRRTDLLTSDSVAVPGRQPITLVSERADTAIPGLPDYPLPPNTRFDPPRDRFGRYKLPNPNTGVEGTHTRATTMANALKDTFGLDDWRDRELLKGLIQYPALVEGLDASLIGTNQDWKLKDQLKAVAENARTAAGANDKREFGTAVHAWTEAVDEGAVTFADVPDIFKRHVAVYVNAVHEAQITVLPEYIERIVYCPLTDTVGTADRLYRLSDGRLVIGDLKGLPLDTPLPTPTGWTTMGAVQTGDKVLGPDGKPTAVTIKSGEKRIGTYVLTFDDGTRMVCDSEHIWWTDATQRRSPDQPLRPTPKPITEVIETLTDTQGQKCHRVPVAAPLDLPEAELPIEPYLLGAWLGDGTASSGSITKGADLFAILEADGWELGKPQKAGGELVTMRTVLGLRPLLRTNDLLDNKHIPAAYLRGSIEQRTRLLQGLLDTDGTWNTARKSVVFCTTDEALARQVTELLRTLGERPRLNAVQRTGFGKTVTAYDVEFNPVNVVPFRLPRKADKARDTKPNFRSTRRVIVSVEPGPDVPTACIGVDNETHVYLAGEEMVPTHNTSSNIDFSLMEIAAQLAQYAHASHMLSQDGTTWLPMPEVDQSVAVVAAAPGLPNDRDVHCDMVLVNLHTGRKLIELAVAVRDARRNAKRSVVLQRQVSNLSSDEAVARLYAADADAGGTGGPTGPGIGGGAVEKAAETSAASTGRLVADATVEIDPNTPVGATTAGAIMAEIDQQTDPQVVGKNWTPDWPEELVAYGMRRVAALNAAAERAAGKK